MWNIALIHSWNISLTTCCHVILIWTCLGLPEIIKHVLKMRYCKRTIRLVCKLQFNFIHVDDDVKFDWEIKKANCDHLGLIPALKLSFFHCLTECIKPLDKKSSYLCNLRASLRLIEKQVRNLQKKKKKRIKYMRSIKDQCSRRDKNDQFLF